MIIGVITLLGVAFFRGHRDGIVADTPAAEVQTEPICGPAALYVICRADEVSASLASLKRQCALSKRGTSLMSLKAAAMDLGFHVEGLQTTLSNLHTAMQRSAGRAILHLPNRKHFVAVLSSTPESLCVVDPTFGCAHWDASRLAQEGWKGHALLITK